MDSEHHRQLNRLLNGNLLDRGERYVLADFLCEIGREREAALLRKANLVLVRKGRVVRFRPGNRPHREAMADRLERAGRTAESLFCRTVLPIAADERVRPLLTHAVYEVAGGLQVDTRWGALLFYESHFDSLGMVTVDTSLAEAFPKIIRAFVKKCHRKEAVRTFRRHTCDCILPLIHEECERTKDNLKLFFELSEAKRFAGLYKLRRCLIHLHRAQDLIALDSLDRVVKMAEWDFSDD